MRLLTTISLLLSIIALQAQSIDYDWAQVPIGGGGYIIGMKIHPSDGNIRYFRTDIGGAYRWNAAEQRLDQLIFFGTEKADYYGVGGIALDPADPNRLILAVGRYCNTNETAILVSNDRGATWAKEIVPGASGTNIYFASNGGRGCTGGGDDQDRQGSPIALNPNNPNELYIGSRGTGLWKLNLTTEAFTPLGTGVIPNNVFPNSVRNVAFHPTQPQYVYVGYAGEGIYRGNTNTGVYEALNTSSDLQLVSDISISKDGNYMMIACKHDGIYKATNLTSATVNFSKVLNYTGTDPDGEAFLTVTCSPHDNNTVVTINSDWQALNSFRVSTNAGATWTAKNGATYNNLYPWHTTGAGSHISQFAFDPDDANTLYFTSWFSTYYTSNYTAATVQWTNERSEGHEETVITDISAFPANSAGNFLGVNGGDQTGFLFSSIVQGQYPTQDIHATINNSADLVKGASTDYCFASPDHIVVSCTKKWDNNTGDIIYSTDGGATFTRSTGYNDNLGKSVVAVSATDPNRVVIATSSGLQYSSNHGASFSNATSTNMDAGACAGASFTASGSGHSSVNSINTSVFSTFRPLAADKVLGCVFYFYDWNDGTFHVSTDSGESFFQVSSGLPTFHNGVGTFDKWRHKTRVTTIPSHAKHVWINFKDDLYRSEDGGENWTRLGNVQRADLIAVGKQITGESYPTIFLYGKANGDSLFGYYRSTDKGATWQLIHNPAEDEVWGGAKVLAGDMEVAGRVYLSAGGLGLFYGDDPNAVQCEADNLLSNHSFEQGMTDWSPRQAAPASASFSVVSNTASEGSQSIRTVVTSTGNNYWDVQVKRNNIPLKAGQVYELSFDARMTTGTANMRYGMNTSVGNNFVMSGTAALTDTWQHFSKTFTPSSSEDVALFFNYGDILGTFYLDNIQIRAVCSEHTIRAKVFLQGAVNGMTMQTNLGGNNLIPLTQPYNSANLNYIGSESVTSLPNNVVDWVLLEIRDAANSATVLERRACFLRNDGELLDLDGSLGVRFHNLPSSAYIAVRHRNHLGVMTAVPIGLN